MDEDYCDKNILIKHTLTDYLCCHHVYSEIRLIDPDYRF